VNFDRPKMLHGEIERDWFKVPSVPNVWSPRDGEMRWKMLFILTYNWWRRPTVMLLGLKRGVFLHTAVWSSGHSESLEMRMGEFSTLWNRESARIRKTFGLLHIHILVRNPMQKAVIYAIDK
jgi:hypothetical protein